MNIVLINPPCFSIEDDYVEPHLGLAYIAAYLQKHGYNADVVELGGSHDKSIKNICTQIPNAKIYGISCYSTAINIVQEIIKYIKSISKNAYIVLGGPHPTAMPEETSQWFGVDSVIVGEGECAFLEIANNIMASQKPPKIIYAKCLDNIDDYPFPIRKPAHESTFNRRFHDQKVASIITSRGCKFKCLYCNSNIMGGGRFKVNYRSSDNVISEIRELKQLGYTAFRFNDDNFGGNPNLIELLEKIKQEEIVFRIFSRIEHLSSERLTLLKDAGCDFISIGIETLNYRNLKVLGRTETIKHMHNLKYAKELGITTRVSFMVGLPYDTYDNIAEYFSLAKELDFDEYAIYPLIPYPGTKIWSNPKDYGYEILCRDYNQYVQMGINGRAGYTLKHVDAESGYEFFPEDVQRWHILADEILRSRKLHMKNSIIAK